MTKAELIEKMAKDAKISKAAAGAALDSFMTNVTNALKKKDGKITLVGFGTFAKVRRKARKGRNPQTGEPLKIKARNAVTFQGWKETQRRCLIQFLDIDIRRSNRLINKLDLTALLFWSHVIRKPYL